MNYLNLFHFKSRFIKSLDSRGGDTTNYVFIVCLRFKHNAKFVYHLVLWIIRIKWAGKIRSDRATRFK